MSHDDDALIILSVEIPPELAECLDRKVAAGPFGASREEVALLYLCNSFGVSLPFKLPEQAADVAEEAADDSDKAAPTPEELAADTPIPGDSGE